MSPTSVWTCLRPRRRSEGRWDAPSRPARQSTSTPGWTRTSGLAFRSAGPPGQASLANLRFVARGRASAPASQPVRPAGLEPATLGLEIPCSIHLSYGRVGGSPSRGPAGNCLAGIRGKTSWNLPQERRGTHHQRDAVSTTRGSCSIRLSSLPKPARLARVHRTWLARTNQVGPSSSGAGSLRGSTGWNRPGPEVDGRPSSRWRS